MSEEKCSNCGKHLSDCDKSCYYREEKEGEKDKRVSAFAYWKLLEAGVSEEDKEMWGEIKEVADSNKELRAILLLLRML